MQPHRPQKVPHDLNYRPFYVLAYSNLLVCCWRFRFLFDAHRATNSPANDQPYTFTPPIGPMRICRVVHMYRVSVLMGMYLLLMTYSALNRKYEPTLASGLTGPRSFWTPTVPVKQFCAKHPPGDFVRCGLVRKTQTSSIVRSN